VKDSFHLHRLDRQQNVASLDNLAGRDGNLMYPKVFTDFAVAKET
jgi:hypothetical protein